MTDALGRAADRANARLAAVPDMTLDIEMAATLFVGTDLPGKDVIETLKAMTEAVADKIIETGEARSHVFGFGLSLFLLGYLAREEVERDDVT